jgi:hypothetical protein
MDNLIEELYNDFQSKKKVAYFNTSKTELAVRCPYCGDSTNDLTHAHFYIQTVTPFKYFCQRCNVKGYISNKTLNDFDSDNAELGREFERSVRHHLKDTSIGGDTLLSQLGKKKSLDEYKEDTKAFAFKKRYMEKRLGVELSTDELKDMRVIMNYSRFIKANNCKNLINHYDNPKYGHRLDLLSHLNKFSIGFLSSDSNFVTFRHGKPYTNGKVERRYFTENLNMPIEVGERTYFIKNDIDILTPVLDVIMTEGIIDLQSVYHNLYEGTQDSNMAFLAVCGKSYNLPLFNLRRLGFLRMNLHIYSDSDVHLNYYKKILDPRFFDKIYVSYNEKEGEKDFGVPLDKIKKRTKKIK